MVAWFRDCSKSDRGENLFSTKNTQSELCKMLSSHLETAKPYIVGRGHACRWKKNEMKEDMHERGEKGRPLPTRKTCTKHTEYTVGSRLFVLGIHRRSW